MKLTAEQFADLAASFLPGYRARQRQERRRTPRVELQAELDIWPIAGEQLGPPQTVCVRDFSSHGLALVHAQSLMPASQFVVQIQRHSGGCVVMLCTVMHCRAIHDNSFAVGADFTCELGSYPGKHAPPKELAAHVWRLLRDARAG